MVVRDPLDQLSADAGIRSPSPGIACPHLCTGVNAVYSPDGTRWLDGRWAVEAVAAVCALCVMVGSAACGSPETGRAPGSTPSSAITVASPPTPTASPTTVTTPTSAPTAAPTATAAPPPPTSAPVAAAPPPRNLCGAPSNPWGYNFCGGATISSPPADFCSYFACIKNFPYGRGYVEECSDGMYSKSGGISGSCSYHGGNLRPLYM